ncbi:V-type ATP synthase subunit I [Halomicroarcula limicola]|uniref:A-type ATP synthase subunit I n=1 Tax=Haloarcula limicola TaxID=1429915 RepID=A0A8J8C4H2_9EURY|nr:V-type ATPase 116kDa subunit family protein [Halomicroarcula limicola]MBV0925302.1 V-type ATP synthase subunit I [Halomicroarcula limicola]
MFRPEKMCRVSVTGSKRVMEEVIESVHDLSMLHVTEYDGSWEGFEPGNPVDGADEASDQLVTVRSLESILDIDEEDAGPKRLVTDDALEEDLEEVRTKVNELDDRRGDVRDDLRDVEERISTMEPFVTLGIDLDLLRGYETLSVAVGEGDADEVKVALADSDVDTFQVFDEDSVVAVFARTDESELQDALVGATFSQLQIPEGDGEPSEYLEELHHRQQQLESKLATVEDELGDLRLDYGGFLLAAEEKLTIEVQKAEAPLTFATTENAFIAEGWIPDERYAAFESAIESDVSEAVDVEKLEVAEYDDGHAHAREEIEHEGGGGGDATVGQTVTAPEAEEEEEGQQQEVAADGGLVTMDDDEPPVIQDNAAPARPFEALVEVVNRPKYGEFDPTVAFFLTFPAFYGFMIGDLGYGILYFLAGYGLYSKMDGDVMKSLGGVAMWAGGFTMLFGVLYGEFFGLHQLGEIVWGGNPPMHKGLQPVYGNYAIAWLTISLLVGMVHLAVGWIFDFVENLEHGLWDALTESGSWLLMLFGLWAWVFSGANGAAPNFLYTAEEGIFAGHPFAFGFAGLPPVNLFTIPVLDAPFSAWLVLFFAGLVLLALADLIEVVEFLNVLVNVLSYTRLAAVLLAKAGMAFVVNLLFFGVYVVETDHGAEWHFGIGHSPAHMLEQGTYHGHEVTSVMFPGLMHSGVAALVGGLLVLVLGHLLVLILGVTSAGLQGVRLEYVEFFGKFFEGGGKKYNPFGYERTYSNDD